MTTMKDFFAACRLWLAHRYHWIAGLLIALAFIARFFYIDFVSDDYYLFLSHWYEHFQQYGWSGIATSDGNYPVSYLYLLCLLAKLGVPSLLGVKLISIVFDVLLVTAAILVARALRGHKVAAAVGVVVAWLPSVILNSAVWGQCDAIYTSFLLLSLWAIITRRPLLPWLFWSFALLFKQQALFFTPVLLYATILQVREKEFSPKRLMGVIGLLLLPHIISFIPALLIGRSTMLTVGIYLVQAATYPSLNKGAINPYLFISDNHYQLGLNIGLLVAAIGVIISLFLLMRKKTILKPETILAAASFFLLLVPFLLPKMMDRYFYAGEVTTVVFILTLFPRFWPIAVLIEVLAIAAYLPPLFHIGSLASLTPFVPIMAIVIIGVGMLLRRTFAATQRSHS